MVKAVIFDVDGTLIDSVDLHAQAWQDIFLQFGVKTDFQAVRDQIGKGGDKLMQVFLSPEQIEQQGKDMEEKRAELFQREYLNKVKPFPALQDLFERLRRDGIKIALASSAKDDELQVYKKVTGIGPFLDEETSSDDVSNSKPAPDIFLAARKRLGIDPRNILAIGDTEYDAESAGKAGMSTIGLLCGGGSAAKLRAAGCVALYHDPADLLKHYDLSPLARRPIDTSRFSSNTHDDTNKERSMSSNNNSLYFLAGLGLGAAVGMLYAPKSGSDTRDFIRSKSKDGTDFVKKAAGDAADLAKQKAGELKKTAVDGMKKGKQAVKASFDTASPASDAVNQAYE